MKKEAAQREDVRLTALIHKVLGTFWFCAGRETQTRGIEVATGKGRE